MIFKTTHSSLILVSLFFWFVKLVTLTSFGQEYIDGIVAVVNEEVITAYDISTFNAEIERNIHRKYSRNDLQNDQIRNKLLEEINSQRIRGANELINQKLIYADFQKKGYKLPKGIVQDRIDSIISSQADGDLQKFEEMLAASSTTMEEFRSRIERNITVDLLISQSIDKNIVISPKQIQDYYKDHSNEFTTIGKIRLQIISFEPKEGELVIDLLKGGADFSDLVRKYSDHESKKKDGDLGWLNESDLRLEFQTGIKGLKVGEVSQPFQIDETSYLIRITDRQPEEVKPLESVFVAIKNKLYQWEKKTRFDQYIEELRNNSYVRVFFKE